MALKVRRPLPAGCLEKPETLGEHLRQARLKRGLLQREVARLMGVNTATLRYWESGRTGETDVTYIPKILSFLVYDPRPRPADLPEVCRRRREALGLTQKALALKLGLDPSSICRFESRRRAGRKVRGRVKVFVSSE